jgi:hypothetical protein
MTTDTARALEHLDAARFSLDVAQEYLSKQPSMQDRIDEMRSEISRLMHELEGEE